MNLLLVAVLLMQDKITEQLIDKLRSESFQEREAAMKELERIGDPAVQLLEHATKDQEPEVVWRAKACLEKIRFNSGLAILKKIEESVAKAKTVAVTFNPVPRAPGGGQAPGWEAAGTFILKEGNKAYVKCTSVLSKDGTKIQDDLVSDGPRFLQFVSSQGGASGQGGINRHDLKSELLPSLIQAGSLVTARTMELLLTSRRQDKERETSLYRLSAFQETGSENLRTLVYTIEYSPSRSTDTYRVRSRLSFDPATWHPLKRHLEIMSSEMTIPSLEILEEFAFDTDIPDDKFKVPEEKK
jgi:outer membrane lipoprotein-sorting protein